MDTGLLTMKQLVVLRLASRGVSVSRIAGILGVSRQDVYNSLSRAKKSLDKAIATIEAYAAAAGPVARGKPGETVEQLLERLLHEADAMGVRLRVGRAEALSILRSVLDDSSSAGVLREETCVSVAPRLGLPIRIPCSLVDMLERLARG